MQDAAAAAAAASNEPESALQRNSHMLRLILTRTDPLDGDFMTLMRSVCVSWCSVLRLRFALLCYVLGRARVERVCAEATMDKRMAARTIEHFETYGNVSAQIKAMTAAELNNVAYMMRDCARRADAANAVCERAYETLCDNNPRTPLLLSQLTHARTRLQAAHSRLCCEQTCCKIEYWKINHRVEERQLSAQMARTEVCKTIMRRLRADIDELQAQKDRAMRDLLSEKDY